MCLKAGLPMLRIQESAGSRYHRAQARKKRRLIEDATMEDADVELIKKVQSTSLSYAARMPWYARTQHQWDEDLKLSAEDLRKSDRAQADALLHEEPRLPAPAQDVDSSSRSSSSDTSSSSHVPSPEGCHPPAVLAAPVLPGDEEFPWAIHAGRQKLYLGLQECAS